MVGAILIIAITAYAFAVRAAWRDLNSTATLGTTKRGLAHARLSTADSLDPQWLASR